MAEGPGPRPRGEDRQTDELLARAADGDVVARDEVVAGHQGLVRHLARRFEGRGEPIEDLEQVANVGLIRAIERFDPARGVKFATYASATILGELKRHLRDRGWAVHTPRSLKRSSLRLGRLRQRLSQRLGRVPTLRELADAADLPEEEVAEALQAGMSYSLTSLDAPVGADSDADLRIDRIGAEDEDLAMAARMAALSDAIAGLPDRSKTILYLRFYEDLTQKEIAGEVGISQMHVSRLLRRAFREIRERLTITR